MHGKICPWTNTPTISWLQISLWPSLLSALLAKLLFFVQHWLNLSNDKISFYSLALEQAKYTFCFLSAGTDRLYFL